MGRTQSDQDMRDNAPRAGAGEVARLEQRVAELEALVESLTKRLERANTPLQEGPGGGDD